MSQTSYAASITKGASGDPADFDSGNILTKLLDESEADIPFGRAVEADPSNGDAKAKLYAGNKLIGVALRDRAKSDLTDGIVGPTEFPMMASGRVWVEVDADVTPSDTVYARADFDPEVFTITWGANFVASNVINGSVDDQAISPVTFSVDHATTLAAVATAIQALAIVDTATVTGAREITVTGSSLAADIKDLSAVTTFTVTLGASQADDTIANVSGPSDSVELGIFRGDAEGGNAIAVSRAKFVTSAVAGENVMLEINLP